MTIPNILSIAGSDSSGGAGIQADIKAISAAGGYAMTAITALTAQNTQAVREVHTPPAEFLAAQLAAVRDDVRIHAIKIGMLADTAIIAVVRDFVQSLPEVPVVLDPVMISSSGARLLDEAAMESLHELIPLATVITPNLPELAALVAEDPARDLRGAVAQAQRYLDSLEGARVPAVLVKGGHLGGEVADNVLVNADGSSMRVPCQRIETVNTHGTGCSLSSAVATRMAVEPLPVAVQWATEWLRGAILAADQLRVGEQPDKFGPVNHFYRM